MCFKHQVFQKGDRICFTLKHQESRDTDGDAVFSSYSKPLTQETVEYREVTGYFS